jgi:hypothetical protein
MNQLIVSLTVLLAMAGCAHAPGAKLRDAKGEETPSEIKLAAFSAHSPGGLPRGWEPLIILRTKKPTHYQLVAEHGRTVLHAKAANAASGLMHNISFDPQKTPWLDWQWKIERLIKNADNSRRATEDSPVRIVLGFDGAKDELPFADQIMFETAKLLTGRDMPYATLMYIWENKAPVGTVIASGRTGRLKKVVAASGTDGVGQWRNFSRNIVEDYEKAFGEKPGRLIGLGVLTDTDNTGDTVEAWYGDIRLLQEPR